MKVLNNPLLSVFPDMAGTTLVYGASAPVYKLLTGTNTRTRRFVYQWTTNVGVFITSPYHSNERRTGPNVPCALPVDIRKALKDPNPVEAVVEILEVCFLGLTGKGYKIDSFTKV